MGLKTKTRKIEFINNNFSTKKKKSNEELLEFLETIKRVTDKFILPKDLKPCVANILATSIEKGNTPDRNNLALVISSELRKKGLETEDIRKILSEWNLNNNPPLQVSQINSVIKSSDKRTTKGNIKYDFGCNNHNLIAFCIDPENKNECPYYKRNFTKQKNQIEPDYIALGWQNKLTLSQRLILFHTIPYLERRRGFPAGSRIYVSVRELNEISGIGTKYFKNNLIILRDYGLIEYETGSSRIWEKKASIIKRKLKIDRAS